jgi:hypothetical protein
VGKQTVDGLITDDARKEMDLTQAQARAELKWLSAKCVDLKRQIAERNTANSEKEATILELRNLQRSMSDYQRASEELTTIKADMKIFSMQRSLCSSIIFSCLIA